MEKWTEFVLTDADFPAAGATVTVYLAGTTTKATLYSDDGVTVASNPLTTSSLGLVEFYAANGKYDISYAGIGLTSFTRQGVIFLDVTEANGGGMTGTGNLVLANSPTIVTPTLTTATLSNPSLTGTVAGAATYSNPTLTAPVINSPAITSIAQLNGIGVVGFAGVPAQYASNNLTGQLAALSATTLYATPALNGAGTYRVSGAIPVTTTGAGGTISFNLICTDRDTNATVTQTVTTPTVTALSTTSIQFVCNTKAGTNIQYSTVFNTITGSPAYALRLMLEFLG